MATKSVKVEAELLRVMRSIEHHLQSASKVMARDVGVTGPQRSVLRAIAKQPGISASAVAEAVQLHASTIAGILQRLLERGLVSRIKSEDDARKAVLHVTEAGKKVVDTRSVGPDNAIKRALGRFGAGDVETTMAVLEAVAAELAEK